jgi:hypothetical protein
MTNVFMIISIAQAVLIVLLVDSARFNAATETARLVRERNSRAAAECDSSAS